MGFDRIEELEAILFGFKLMPIPKEALFLAGKVFLQYRTNNGAKNFVLPDFFIGAHASILAAPLLTREEARYKTYFPQVQIIAP